MDDLGLKWMVIRLKMDGKKDDCGRSFEPKWTVLGQNGQSWVKVDGQSSKMDVQFNPHGSSTRWSKNHLNLKTGKLVIG